MTEKRKSKLHEILAVEGGLEKTAKKLVAESKKTFSKANLFSGSLRKLEMIEAADEHLESEEFIKLETTVDDNLKYSLSAVARYWDAVLQKDCANQIAKADIIAMNGDIIAKDIPVTTLLGLESKLGDLRTLFEAIPTLSPGIIWESDENNRDGVFKAKKEVVQLKDKKDIDFRVLYEATKEHPAQIREFNTTKIVGKYITTMWSGMITPKRKASLLFNLEEILASVKQARQRANNAYLADKTIGADLINFITK